MSWLQDKVWSDLHKVDTGPEWMKGRFGTLVYGLIGGLFILFGIIAGIHVLIYGPKKHDGAANASATVNSSTESKKPTGAF